jgi:hypothetical protein
MPQIDLTGCGPGATLLQQAGADWALRHVDIAVGGVWAPGRAISFG